MFRFYILVLFSFLLFQAKAQTCSIVSSDIVCKEELMSFDVTASLGISSVSWDMGDGTTSTQQSFSHKYSTKGIKNVKVTVNLTGGGTCVATKQITVYEIPQFKISLKPDNSYCLSQNKVCLIDSSLGGDVGITIQKRIILWDDGDQTTTNSPAVGNEVCHIYKNTGTFKITIELTNDKGCKAKKEIVITILPDVVPEFTVAGGRGCDSAALFIEDVTMKDTGEIVNRIYNWGDGNKTTTKSRKGSHIYKSSGFYKVGLTLVQKNGCLTSKDTVVEIFIPNIKFNITKDAYSKCYGNDFRIEQNDALISANYDWNIGGFQKQGKVVVLAPYLGKNYIKLTISYAGCIKQFKYDSIEVYGIIPQFNVLNQEQCQNKDTVYFCEKDTRYGTKRVSFLWNFGDDLAPQCTTSFKNNINTKANCNFSTDSIGKHLYVNKICRNWKLTIKDLDYGCNQEAEGIINVIKPDTFSFGYLAKRFCLGLKPDYRINFYKSLCPVIEVKMNLDSACSRKNFVPFTPFYTYQQTCNSNGWVTVGFAIKYGNKKVYRTVCDTSDYYIDPNRECFDTIWFHNWYRLMPEPFPPFEASGKCIPAEVKPTLFVPYQDGITFTTWNWGDNTKTDTLVLASGDSMIPQSGHIYKKAGAYNIHFYVENQNKCYNTYDQKLLLGFEMKMDFDSVICPDINVLFKEKINYLFNSTDYWHDASRKLQGKELFKWDFDDGRGFVTDTAGPVIKFPSKGIYKIRLSAKDSSNCTDTIVKQVYVGGVNAGIRKISKKIICDDIIQLFDSSYSDYKLPLDSITTYYWDFGDGRNPSYLKSPFHYYSTYGNYTVFQRVGNPRGCTDTAYIHFTIEGPVANFKIVSDTVGCVPFKAEFKNTSIKTRDFIWYFGDPLKTKLSTNRDTNVTFTYTQPGTYYIYLFGSDSVVNPNAGNAIYYCKTFFPDTNIVGHPVRKIIVLPAPKADFNVNYIQCKNRPIAVSSNSDPVYTLHRWTISHVDSIETTDKNGVLFSKDTGTFSIKYKPWYPPQLPYNLSCPDSAIKQVRVTEIKAAFDLVKDTTSCPVFTFTNQTKNYQSITWNLGDSTAGDDKNIRHENQVTYSYTSRTEAFYPCLYTENKDGCRDTLCTVVNVDFIKKLIIPNVFTPGNNDHLNDAYDIVAEGMDEYHLVIYNRWGQKLFETNVDGIGDDGNNWRGRANVVSDLYPDGTYFYIFNYKFKCEDKAHRASGTITLIGTKE